MFHVDLNGKPLKIQQQSVTTPTLSPNSTLTKSNEENIEEEESSLGNHSQNNYDS